MESPTHSRPHETSPSGELTLEVSPPHSVGRPRIWTLWATLAAACVAVVSAQSFIGVVLAVTLLSQGIPLPELQEAATARMSSPWYFIVLLFLGPGSFGLVALVAARFSPEPWRVRLDFVPPISSRTRTCLAVLGSLCPAIVSMAIAEWITLSFPQLPVDESAKALFTNMTPLWAIVFVIVVGLLPGFGEELLFRGYIQRRLIERWNPFWGIGLTSVLFGLAHVMPAHVLLATIIGVYLGVVAWKTGSIWPSIAAHILINSGVNTWRTFVFFSEIDERTQMIVIGVVLVVSAICCVLFWLLPITISRRLDRF